MFITCCPACRIEYPTIHVRNTHFYPVCSPTFLVTVVTTSSLDLTEASAEDTKKIVWEWEGDGGKWTKYDDQYSIKITKALTDREDDVILQVAPTVKLNVRFNSMTQMNVRTGWQRDVRCLSNERAEWEWQDEHGKWNKYSPSVQRLLVACQECGVVERKLEAAGRRYKVDLVLKKQTNLETRVMRKVRVSGGDGEWLP